MSYLVCEKMIPPDRCYSCSGPCSCEPYVVQYASDDDDPTWWLNAPWAQEGAIVKESATG